MSWTMNSPKTRGLRLLGVSARSTSPIVLQMPTGEIISNSAKVTWGPGLRSREREMSKWGWNEWGGDDRCFNVAWTRDRGRNWTRVWIGRGKWRIDRTDTGGTW